MDLYTHSLREDLGDAPAGLPMLDKPISNTQRETGTDNSSVALRVAQKGATESNSAHSDAVKTSKLSSAPTEPKTDSHPKKTAISTGENEADGEGFEPPVPCGTTVFKTVAFVHSATHP